MATDNRNQSGGQGGGQGSNMNQGNQSGSQGSGNRDQDDNNRDDTSNEGYQAGEVGKVKDPSDGRLKENRDAGVSLGTTEHSKQAPNAENEGNDPQYKQEGIEPTGSGQGGSTSGRDR